MTFPHCGQIAPERASQRESSHTTPGACSHEDRLPGEQAELAQKSAGPVDADNLLMPAMALHDRNLAVEDDEEVAARSLHFSDRQNVVYAAAVAGVMPRSWKRVCMPMRRVS